MFYERIKELRNSLGINQVEFGKRINVSKQCVSNWESGYIQPSIDVLVRIATTFSVSADYLLGLNDKPTLDVEGLTNEQILHIRAIIDDIRK
ncbi:helix-turn-helix domain-containing protein [Ruminococcus sp.]|jgi:transcriptional regulator with XRE-family HTH domain